MIIRSIKARRWAQRIARGGRYACFAAALLPVSQQSCAGEEPADDGYVFLGGLELSSSINKGSLARFSRVGSIEPGSYRVDLYLNGGFVERKDIVFKAQGKGPVQACFSISQLQGLGVSDDALKAYAPGAACQAIGDLLAGASASFDLSALKLNVQVPQSLLDSRPRGYIDPRQFDAGSAIAFVNYNASQYASQLAGSSSSSTYLSTGSGVNLGMWRLRQQGSLRYDNRNGANWNLVRTYAKRALPGLRSELTLGESYTSGMFFSGLGYQGVELASDDRMLPESQQGYAPVIRGTARTNAQVVVSQKGREIYRTTVPPGPFDIKDLFPTSYNGDLDVTVLEADGTRSQFSVPFSAVPESMRPGIARYSVLLGRTRDTEGRSLFSDVTYQLGVSNSLTANTGLRIASGYQSMALGGSHASGVGAIGLNLNYSRADLGQERRSSGWMGNITYSHTFDRTGTSFSIASYRYSTAGYRELGDVLSERLRAQWMGRNSLVSSTYKQRSRFSVSLNQQLGSAGSVYLSALTQNYYDSRSRVVQLQAGYSTVVDGISFNAAVQRQQMTQDAGAAQWGNAGAGGTSILLSISIPLGAPMGNRPVLSSSLSRANGLDTYQSSLTGTLDEQADVNYGLDVTKTAGAEQSSISGNIGKRFSSVSVNASASKGNGYVQGAATVRGAVAIHDGGLTFGQYLSDTFALIEAPGAEGSKVFNGQGGRVDSSGYALVPSLLPYRHNLIGLMSEGMSSKVELIEGQRDVIPYAGAAVKVKFKTRQGNALLIQVRRVDGSPVPMGADVVNDEGTVIGMVGQGSQAYVRTENVAGSLMLRWGVARNEQCEVRYDLTGQDLRQPLLRIKAICSRALEMTRQDMPANRSDHGRTEQQ